MRALPQDDTTPEVWILGSSDYGAQVAAHFGLPYAFAWFFTDGRGGREAIEIYKAAYRPSARHPEPHAAICVLALVADSEEEAAFQYQSRARTRLLRDRGVFAPLEAPEVAGAYDYTDHERARMDEMRRRALVGTPADVAERIRDLAATLGLAEIAVVTWAWDEAVRHNSYRLLAEAMGLGAGVQGQSELPRPNFCQSCVTAGPPHFSPCGAAACRPAGSASCWKKCPAFARQREMRHSHFPCAIH